MPKNLLAKALETVRTSKTSTKSLANNPALNYCLSGMGGEACILSDGSIESIRPRKFIPDVAFRSPVRIFGASGCQELPVWSGGGVPAPKKDYLVEKQLISTLVDGLKSRGNPYATFGRELEEFIDTAAELKSNTSPLRSSLIKTRNYISYESLLIVQRKNQGNELIDATIDYLKARYPSLTDQNRKIKK